MRTIKDDTQTMDVLAYLRSHKAGITSTTAFRELGVTRLSAVIHRLRHIWSFNIETINVTVKNRRGKAVDIARYVLIEEEEEANE